jgi:hypothetical protein
MNKQDMIDYLMVKRENAIVAGDYKTAYSLTTWINFVSRNKPTTADLRMVAYQVKQDKQNQPASQLTLF